MYYIDKTKYPVLWFMTSKYHVVKTQGNINLDEEKLWQSMPITSVHRSWPMQIVKDSLYVMIELLKLTDVS